MEAQEILKELRALEAASPGTHVELECEFDQGSLVDQLWEEHAFYNPIGLNTVATVRLTAEAFYEIEVVRILADEGKVVYWNKCPATASDPLQAEEYNMITAKRRDLHLDYPVSYVDCGSFRWGVEEHPECDEALQLFYQDRKGGTGVWEKSDKLDTLISLEMWKKIKVAAKFLFLIVKDNDEGDDESYITPTLKIFDGLGDGHYCTVVREHPDCEDCLQLAYQELSKVKDRGYVDKEELAGAFEAYEWVKFEAMVDAFIAEHLT